MDVSLSEFSSLLTNDLQLTTQLNGVVERVIGTLRRELLDHLIPLDAAHLQQLLTEYVQQYYHPKRTHQANNRQSPIPPAPPPATCQTHDPAAGRTDPRRIIS